MKNVNEGFYVLVDTESNKNKKFYYTSNNNFCVLDKVIVETSLGEELGIIHSNPVSESEIVFEGCFEPIVRSCTEKDLTIYEANLKEALIARKIFIDSINKLNLDMKFVACCYSLDKSKLLFTYISEERVDFRDLLKELSYNLKCRIELRQIGARDRSKAVGGLGVCGLPLCCSTFLNEFEGISINMAKNQFLSLNTQKLSGQCGKLLCCLKFEDNDYSTLKIDAPRLGQKFKHENTLFRISYLNLLSGKARIESEDREIITNISINELNNILKGQKK